eukprot:scaffold10.g2486.t1
MAAAPAAKRVTLGLGKGAHQALEAAVEQVKATQFFREISRCIPTVVRQYKLEELATVPELRSNVATIFRKYADVTNPQVVDMLIYKGREELEIKKPTGNSTFLDAFYKSN